MRKYSYFGKAANGSMIPIFECVAEVDPTPQEANTIYQEIVRQQGLGVPRPTHFAALELVEIAETDEVGTVPIGIYENGKAPIVH
jgi:hypothetical protein